MTLLDLISAFLGVPLVAGALGGVIRWVYLKEPLWQGAGGVLTGAIFAHYFASFGGQWFAAFADFTNVDDASGRAAGAFLIGIAGVWPVQWAIDFGRRKAQIQVKDS